jgi:hypothetical protein
MPGSRRLSATQAPQSHYDGEAYDGLFNNGGIPPGRGSATTFDSGEPGNPPRPRTRAEARALPSGTHFIDPMGVLRVRH